jgi:hypothetical protein
MTVGTHVEIHFPGQPDDKYPVAKLVGFYSNEPCRAVVLLPTGESLVVMQSDIVAVSDQQARRFGVSETDPQLRGCSGSDLPTL